MIKKFLRSCQTFLAVIGLHSSLRKDEIYYPQVIWKGHKFIEKKVVKHTIDVLESYSDNFNDFDDSDAE